MYYSILMPTYNSERTIERALNGIRNQDLDQNEVEILVIDGGSTDRTREIALKYGAIIIDNPYRLPEPANLIGMQHVSGKYLCVMGSDEIMEDPTILRRRAEVMDKHPEIHGMRADLIAPKDYSILCTYMNAVGDPFSCFVYRSYGDYEYSIRKNLIKVDEDVNFYHFSEKDIIPIGDGVTVLNMDYIRKEHGDLIPTHGSSLLWNIVIRDNGMLAYIHNDKVLHLSKCDFKTYIKKLKFRVVNNVHNVQGSGYSFRAKSDKTLSRRKYLYPLYCLLFPWPIYDGIQMTMRMNNKVFLLHPFFVWYVMIEIIIQYIKKGIGRKTENKVYGQ